MSILAVEQFFRKYPSHTLKKGGTIIHPDSHPSGAYYLEEGFVRQYTVSDDGTELTIHIFSPESFFPMTWVMDDIPNRYYYEALTPVTFRIAPKDAVVQFLKSNPDVIYDFTGRLLQGLDKLTLRIEYLVFHKAYSKVISSLLFLARHFGEVIDGQVHLKFKFTHRDIASLSGTTRETTSREWEKIESKGLIVYDKQHIVIPDIKKLEAELPKSE